MLEQLSHDHRSVALIVLMPSVLLLVFRYVYDSTPMIFDRIGPQMLGLFPFIIMFLVTSVTMVRERTSGTLERLLTTPLRRGELIGGYALGFGVAALVQSLVSSAVAIWLLGLDVQIPWAIGLFAVIDAVLGTALGLLMSAFATTEFQAVQFMPLVVVPQILLCGLLLPRDQMPRVLELISDVLPLSYATDAFTELVERRHVQRRHGARPDGPRRVRGGLDRPRVADPAPPHPVTHPLAGASGGRDHRRHPGGDPCRRPLAVRRPRVQRSVAALDRARGRRRREPDQPLLRRQVAAAGGHDAAARSTRSRRSPASSRAARTAWPSACCGRS